MTNRREFLQTTAAFAGSLILPTSLFATPSSNFHFLHVDSYKDWPVPNPVRWSLQNAHEPILGRAAEGLGKLTSNDADRIIRLVLRRCSLNLLEIQGNRVHVQFWGTNGQADLKPFFKTHGLARTDIRVELRDRKKETVTTLTGDSFLYGVPIASNFPLELLHQKWTRRFSQEADDRQSAPQTASGFSWDGVEDGMIPWAALKSAWRQGGSGVCLNCSGDTLLVNFGLRQVGMFNRSGFVEHVCGRCGRLFEDSVEDVPGWIVANLDEDVRPDAEMVWGKRVKRESQSRTTTL